MTAKNHNIRIVINGTQIRDWVSYEIESDIMQPADAFSFVIANPSGRYAGEFLPFHQAQLFVDDTLQMSGYVDTVSCNSDRSTIEITGRDVFGQLVDCDADPQTINNKTLLEIAQDLSRPYGVLSWSVDNEQNRAALQKAKNKLSTFKRHRDAMANVLSAAAIATGADAAQILNSAYDETRSPDLKRKLDAMRNNIASVKLKVFPKIKIEPGQKVFEIIKDAANKSGLMLWCANDGTGIIAKPNYNQSAAYTLSLRPYSDKMHGVNNVIRGTVTFDGSNRYSQYRILATTGNTRQNYERSSIFDTTMIDPDVAIDRKIILLSEGRNRSDVDEIARKEYTERAFNAITAEYDVVGHSQNGMLFQADSICSVDDQVNGLSAAMYITSRRFRGSDAGQTTTIKLNPIGLLLA